MHISVLLSVQHGEPSQATLISFEHMFEHDFHIQEDEERRSSFRAQRLLDRPALQKYGLVEAEHFGSSALSNSSEATGELISFHDANPHRSTSLDNVLNPVYEDLFDNNKLDVDSGFPKFTAGYNLSDIERLADPTHVFQEIASMVRI